MLSSDLDMENEVSQKKEYRISFLIKEEDASPVRSVIVSNGGEIVKEQAIAKIRLAYPVKRELFGFAGGFIFTIEPEAIPKILQNFKLNVAVLRVMITADVPKEEEDRRQGFSSTPNRARSPRRVVREQGFGAQLSNEALEKKIEEILQ